MLRTADDGEPRQVILPTLTVRVEVTSLEGLPISQRRAAAMRLARDEARRSFDPGVGEVLRARVFRLSERTHLLLIGLHHIVSDTWSLGIFLSQLSHFYNRGTTGDGVTLPALPIQYAELRGMAAAIPAGVHGWRSSWPIGGDSSKAPPCCRNCRLTDRDRCRGATAAPFCPLRCRQASPLHSEP